MSERWGEILEILRKIANGEITAEPLEACPRCGYKLRGDNYKALKVTHHPPSFLA